MAIQRIALFILYFLRTRRFARQLLSTKRRVFLLYPLSPCIFSPLTDRIAKSRQAKTQEECFSCLFLSISRVLDTEIVTLRIILSL